jgi:glycosyltransferase involved in cell wall biosynthesis
MSRNDRMNILLIDHYAGSPRYGMEYRPYYFAREWVRSGHDVTVVAATFSHLRIQQPTVKSDWSEERIDGIRYLWLKTPSYKGNGPGRVRSMFCFTRKLWLGSRRLARQYRPNLVIASSTYPLDNVPARRIARFSYAKLVYEVHDLWPLSPMELGGMSPHHPFIMLMQWAENYAYRHSDRVVSLLPVAIGHMQEHGMAPEKFCYIPNGVSLDEWTGDDGSLPEEHQTVLRQLKEEGRFLVGYAGGHALSNALDCLLDAAQRLQGKPVSIVLVGRGVEKERLQRKAREMGLANVAFLPPVPKRLMPSVLREFDACYLGWARSPLYRFGVCPNKLLDYMMAGKPVIHAIEAGNDLVADANCGISLPPEDPDALAAAIVEMSTKSREERAAMGQRSKAFVTAHHLYPHLADKFLNAVAEENANRQKCQPT